MRLEIFKGIVLFFLSLVVVSCQSNSEKPSELTVNLNDAARVCGYSQGTWSLAKKYKSIAEEKGYDCSKYPKPQLVKKTIKTQCASNPNVCEDLELCAKATTKISGKTDWSKKSASAKFIAEAKRRRLTCNVAGEAKSSMPKPTKKIVEVGSGSAFYVSKDGHLVTNFHVIDQCSTIKLKKGRAYVTAEVISEDPVNDLALIKVANRPKRVFALSGDGPSSLMDIYVAGYPFGDSFSSFIKFTKGVVSAEVGVGNDFTRFQIDAALQPGNSGGPIIDDYGNVVGVAVAKLKAKAILEATGVLPENTNFGVKISAVKNLLKANSIQAETPSSLPIKKLELKDIATDATVMVTCWLPENRISSILERNPQKVFYERFQNRQ